MKCCGSTCHGVRNRLRRSGQLVPTAPAPDSASLVFCSFRRRSPLLGWRLRLALRPPGLPDWPFLKRVCNGALPGPTLSRSKLMRAEPKRATLPAHLRDRVIFDVENTPLRTSGPRRADHPGADGDVHIGGTRGCRIQRRRVGRHRIAVPAHRNRQTRHRCGKDAHQSTVCDQPHPTKPGCRSVSLHPGGTAAGHLLHARRSRRPGAAGSRCRRAGDAANHHGRASRPGSRTRRRRDHSAGWRVGWLLWRSQHDGIGAAGRRRRVADPCCCLLAAFSMAAASRRR